MVYIIRVQNNHLRVINHCSSAGALRVQNTYRTYNILYMQDNNYYKNLTAIIIRLLLTLYYIVNYFSTFFPNKNVSQHILRVDSYGLNESN